MNLSAFCKKSLAFAVLFAALIALPAAAQTSGVGNITGDVTDTSGAAVSAAAVVVLNTDTGIARNLTTDSNGHYSATFLQPGHYTVTIGAAAPSERSIVKISSSLSDRPSTSMPTFRLPPPLPRSPFQARPRSSTPRRPRSPRPSASS